MTETVDAPIRRQMVQPSRIPEGNKSMPDIWITWEIQRRNEGMAQLLNAELKVLLSQRRGALRHLELSLATLRLIRRARPSRIYCQNPSLVLALLCVVLRPLFRFELIVDEHNAGLFPSEGTSALKQSVANYIAKKANAVIVSNHALAIYAESIGAKPVVCPDPIPKLSTEKPSLRAQKLLDNLGNYALVVCSWAADEPYQEVISAASVFANARLDFVFTGRAPATLEAQTLPSNVTLSGFLDRSDYDQLLRNALFLIVLTRREDCLNCGAYEAVAAGVPALLSDTRVIRETFSAGFHYVQPNESDIIRGIEHMRDHRDEEAAQLSKTAKYLTYFYETAAADLGRQAPASPHIDDT